MAMTEDLTAFFDPDEFAVSATLAGVPVTGIFDNAFDEQALAMGLAGTVPLFTLASGSVPSPVVGQPLVYGGTTYTVVETLPDGTGITRLRLRT
jgi:hypothetical protein